MAKLRFTPVAPSCVNCEHFVPAERYCALNRFMVAPESACNRWKPEFDD